MITFGEVEPAGLRAIKSLIDEGICRSATYHDETSSTNTLACDDLRNDPVAPDQLPRIYLADRQTAGRGRHGRTWQSNQGTLTFSILIDWQLERSLQSKLLSLAVGVGVARAIEFTFAPLRSRLKWPNDVYIDGGKVAGILIETSQSIGNRVVIGVGVNISQAPTLPRPTSQDGTQSEAPPPRSIAQVTGKPVERYEVLEPLVAQILTAIHTLQENESEILSEFRSRCLLTGNQVSYQQGESQQEGTCRGITDKGELAIQTQTGVHHLQSGEARVVRNQKA